mmetsp:Transcript_29778/g.60520  ORF Transcript_29778/g.60520 Transcript_29778/m.60520 type:complete len:228 (-) Transcript_29778:381-1064(-)
MQPANKHQTNPPAASPIHLQQQLPALALQPPTDARSALPPGSEVSLCWGGVEVDCHAACECGAAGRGGVPQRRLCALAHGLEDCRERHVRGMRPHPLVVKPDEHDADELAEGVGVPLEHKTKHGAHVCGGGVVARGLVVVLELHCIGEEVHDVDGRARKREAVLHTRPLRPPHDLLVLVGVHLSEVGEAPHRKHASSTEVSSRIIPLKSEPLPLPVGLSWCVIRLRK